MDPSEVPEVSPDFGISILSGDIIIILQEMLVMVLVLALLLRPLLKEL